jgi:hypothetical protein
VKSTRLILALSLALILILGSVSWSGPPSPTTTPATSSAASPAKQSTIPTPAVPARPDTKAPVATAESGTAKALKDGREEMIVVSQLNDYARYVGE